MKPQATTGGNSGDRRRRSSYRPASQGCVLPLMMGVSALWGGGTDSALPPFPLEAEGDIRFAADAVVFLDAADRPEGVLYLNVPEQDLVSVSIPDRAGDWMQLDASVTFLSSGQDPLVRLSNQLDVRRPSPPEEEWSGSAQEDSPARSIIRLVAPLAEDAQGIEVEVCDRNATRRGLIPLLGGKHKRGVARGNVTVPDLSGGWAVSAPLFLWDHSTEGLSVADGGWVLGDAGSMRGQLDPHPTHSYGLKNSTLTIYLELYGLELSDTELTTRVSAWPGDQLLYENKCTLRPEWHRCGAMRMLDVSRLPAGTYAVEFMARPAASPAQAVRSGLSTASAAQPGRVTGRFQVQWDPQAWEGPHSEQVEEASLLFEGDSWEHFMSLEPGQQEVALDSLWRALGGDDRGAAMYEAKARFRERVSTADARYGGVQRGCLADRGRVFVHFGEPDEIHKELAPQEEDLLYKFLEREVDEMDASGTGGRPRVHWLNSTAYQIWYYNRRGDPLLPSQALRVRDGELRFIFMDRMGTGNYQLIYTNLFGGMI